jgi:hypothetical protein
MNFLIWELISVALQFVLFFPFYLKWRKDCKEIGKDNLAVSLSERFTTWIVCFPLWIIPILIFVK